MPIIPLEFLLCCPEMQVTLVYHGRGKGTIFSNQQLREHGRSYLGLMGVFGLVAKLGKSEALTRAERMVFSEISLSVDVPQRVADRLRVVRDQVLATEVPSEVVIPPSVAHDFQGLIRTALSGLYEGINPYLEFEHPALLHGFHVACPGRKMALLYHGGERGSLYSESHLRRHGTRELGDTCSFNLWCKVTHGDNLTEVERKIFAEVSVPVEVPRFRAQRLRELSDRMEGNDPSKDALVPALSNEFRALARSAFGEHCNANDPFGPPPPKKPKAKK